jgi:hypothetical protein
VGRIAGLSARFEGYHAARDERVDRWLTFLRQWMAAYQPRQIQYTLGYGNEQPDRA